MTKTRFAFALLALLTLGAGPAFADGTGTGQMSADQVACAAQNTGNSTAPQGTAKGGSASTDVKAGSGK
jgi:hypothetical protein